MKLVGWAIGLYLFYRLMQQGGLGNFGLPGGVVAIPGTQIPLPGGLAITVPGGTTYRLRDGHTVTVPASTQTAPGGWVLGNYDDGSWVWFNPYTGAIQQYVR